jgi:hypothetical protein
VQAYLDDRPLAVAGETLADALRAGRALAVSAGRVIVEVQADGATVPGAHLSHPPADDPYASVLRLRTAVPSTLVRETLLEAAEVLPLVRSLQTSAAEQIQSGRTADAMTKLSEALRLWGDVRQVVHDGCALLGVPAMEGWGDDALTDRMASDLIARLTDLKRAVARQDWASLADLLAYELEEQALRWELAIRKMAGRLAARAAGASAQSD